jgi:conjugative transfer signal peptidase TraF
VQFWRVKVIRGLCSSAGSRISRAKRIGAVVLLILVGMFQVAGSLGLRINTSPSLPVGLYITTNETAAQLVEFCPAEPYAHLAIARGYRDAGVCADGAAPLLKPVIAQLGDVVEVSPAGLSVNGQRLPNTAAIAADTKGRTLAAWPAGTYEVQPGTIWVASSYNRRSFDSRYFGPIALAAVRDRVKPLITGGK